MDGVEIAGVQFAIDKAMEELILKLCKNLIVVAGPLLGGGGFGANEHGHRQRGRK
jgi:hypothetical protein